MEKLFKLKARGTDTRTEIIAGLTTFMTMAYVLAVQPFAICGGAQSITDVNGVEITRTAIMVSCALISGLITLLMAFYTNFPFALSTGMGSNFLLGALITGGLLFLRQAANDYLVRESASLLASYGMSGLIQYLGINLEIVKMGIGAYLCPFLALLSLLLMGIKKKAPEPRYEASPYPARRSGAQQPRPAQKTAQAWQEMSKELRSAADPAPRPGQSAAPSQNAAPRPSQNAAPRPSQSAVPAAEAASIQAGRVPLPGEQSWTCAYCGRRMEADKNFCDLCGSTRPKRREAIYCSACGAKLRPDARFCSNCGRSVVTEEKSGGAAAEDQRETQERRP